MGLRPCSVELPESDWHYVDDQGDRTTKQFAAGRLVKHKIIHPRYILHGDEVGTDMCQEGDGHIGGQKYLTIRGKRVRLVGTKSKHRFTLMCLTAATGEAVMFIIIFAAKELDFTARFGYDHQAKEPYDPTIDAYDQIGPGKAFPGAPYCEFDGKRIPAIVGMSPKGSMTSPILATALDELDRRNVYPRVPGGPIPCCLFDAHDTRLQIPLLERVNRKIVDNDPAWVVSIGLPNGTSAWQAGDSSEQNGSYKMAMTREKDALVAYKRRMEMSVALQRSDILPLIHRTIAPSFRCVESNKKALRARGWLECNWVLMDHPEVVRNTVQNEATLTSNPESAAPPPESTAPSVDAPKTSASDKMQASSCVEALENLNLNVVDGVAGTYAQDILQYAVKKDAVHRKYNERKKEGTEARQRFSKAAAGMQLTGGLMFRERHTRCDDEVLKARRNAEQRKKDGKAEKAQDKAARETEEERKKQKDKLDAIQKEVDK